MKLAQRGIILMLLLVLGGCGGWGTAAGPAEAPDRVEVEAQEVPAEGEVVTVVETVEVEKEVEERVAPAGGGEAAPEALAYGDEEAAVEAEPLATVSPAGGDTTTMAEPGRTGEGSEMAPEQSEPLRAGEVDDNAAWDDYLLYRQQYGGLLVHERDVSERYVVEVVDGQGQPVLGAEVRFLIPGGQEVYKARTYANGRVLFHPLALDVPLATVERFEVEVGYGELTEQFSLTRLEAQAGGSFTDRWTVRLEGERQAGLALDVLFLVDATGSMADEINKIQSTIFEVAAQIDALPGEPEVRYGLVTYRDRGDSFVTRHYDFTPDVRDFSKNLDTLYADGGGDEPESLNEGLHVALHEVEWRGAGTVQLIFLVADAPPHLDYPQDYDYAVEMGVAAERGIKIFPLASSGLNEQGEYIFRQLAQFTQGRFLFLTYEGATNGGEPGEVTTHHVEDYSVANLDVLLVRLVGEELAFQGPEVGGQ